MFDTAAILIVIAALFGFLNHHTFRLPFTIGLMISALLASVGILFLDYLFPSLGLGLAVRFWVATIDFHESLMHGMLSFLLFAGALHVDLDDLLQKKGPILTLASVGVLLSTALIGFGSYGLFHLLGISISLPYCLVFGALISPTDPVAVIGILRSAGVPESIETKITGESLFNDGTGVILFSLLVMFATGASTEHAAIGGTDVAIFFLREVAGGILLGLVAGYGVFRAIRTLDEPNLEILISVALVMGITFLAFQVHASAPLACVTAGLFIGNHGRKFAMGKRTVQALDLVWSFLDHSLNAVLFLLIGLEIVAIRFSSDMAWIILIFIPLALLARFASVGIPISALRLRYEFTPGVVKILTWGGLKGGISIALALSLPPFQGRPAVLSATYAIVLFSIMVQGLTIGRVVQKQQLAEK